MLVDDDEITIYLNESLLANLQVSSQIASFTDGDEALKSIQHRCPFKNCPDLILLDLNMPVFDGFEFLEAFKKLPSDKTGKVQIVVLTSSSNPNDLQRVKELGVNQILNKPLNLEKIQSILN